MPTKTASPTYLPYRENGAVKYAPPPTSSFSSDSRLYNTHISYDSDNEPLISNSIIPSELNEYDLAHFTATGRKHSLSHLLPSLENPCKYEEDV